MQLAQAQRGLGAPQSVLQSWCDCMGWVDGWAFLNSELTTGTPVGYSQEIGSVFHAGGNGALATPSKEGDFTF